ncbi:MAG: YdjC family protein [Ramlibacter sp.]|nr:YdjC family protein [Ramlibacter sp.]
MDKRIAVCVDDFGLHAGVNEAVLRLAAQQRITATSCLVGAPQWPERAALLKSLPPGRVDVGLHLDLTEYPVTPAVGWPLPVLMTRSCARLLDRATLRAEIDAQLARFERELGRAPDYVDGHQHVHQFPVVRDVLLAALLERYPQQRPWLRRTRQPAGLAGGFKPWLIERLGCKALGRLAHLHGYPQNESLLGVYDFKGDAARYLALLAAWIETAQDGDLLMCHAGLAAAADDPIGPARRNEYEVLSGAAFGELLERSNVSLAPLSQLRPRGRHTERA